MPDMVACPACPARLRLAGGLPAGSLVKCARCGHEFPVPAADAPPPRPAAPPSPHVLDRPLSPPRLETVDPDEDVPPTPAHRGEADLTGNVPADTPAWMGA